MDSGTGTAVVPASTDLAGLRAAASGCRACELWQPATQTVFGAGPVDARIVFVGEQPGDVEDRRGEPFVGPAGRLLDRALADAGIDRDISYVTNTVKHFRFRPGGRRRIHQTPGPEHVAACRPWLDAELALIAPDVVVCLGATAARTLLGSAFRITTQRGRLMPYDGPAAEEDAAARSAWIMATTHPSAVLRVPGDQRPAAYDALVADLRIAAGALA
ncbi:MAG TPA: UdgX family uracil-DNA binding protein [Mycobacteriales bacterium]|nr:UdgX family uracil-DNA binding protein [Mycobacteriales bacterium]